LERHRFWGVDVIVYREAAEPARRFIPVAWTDLAEPDPWRDVCGGRSPFRWPDLLRLAALIRELTCQEDFAASGKRISPDLARRSARRKKRASPNRQVLEGDAEGLTK
jgi:Family of unknown function (DUF5372)